MDQKQTKVHFGNPEKAKKKKQTMCDYCEQKKDHCCITVRAVSTEGYPLTEADWFACSDCFLHLSQFPKCAHYLAPGTFFDQFPICRGCGSRLCPVCAHVTLTLCPCGCGNPVPVNATGTFCNAECLDSGFPRTECCGRPACWIPENSCDVCGRRLCQADCKSKSRVVSCGLVSLIVAARTNTKRHEEEEEKKKKKEKKKEQKEEQQNKRICGECHDAWHALDKKCQECDGSLLCLSSSSPESGPEPEPAVCHVCQRACCDACLVPVCGKCTGYHHATCIKCATQNETRLRCWRCDVWMCGAQSHNRAWCFACGRVDHARRVEVSCDFPECQVKVGDLYLCCQHELVGTESEIDKQVKQLDFYGVKEYCCKRLFCLDHRIEKKQSLTYCSVCVFCIADPPRNKGYREKLDYLLPLLGPDLVNIIWSYARFKEHVFSSLAERLRM